MVLYLLMGWCIIFSFKSLLQNMNYFGILLLLLGGIIYTMGSSIGGDAGIDTDGKFEINGGEVIALGSDMLKKPDEESNQEYVSFTLNSKIHQKTKHSLFTLSTAQVLQSAEQQQLFSKTIRMLTAALLSQKHLFLIWERIFLNK